MAGKTAKPKRRKFGNVTLWEVTAGSLQQEPPPEHACGSCGSHGYWTHADRTDWVCVACHPPPPTLDHVQRIIVTPLHPATYALPSWLQTPPVPYKPLQRGATEEYGPC